MIWQGLLGSPSRLFHSSPILAYNLSLALTFLLSGLAMFWLIAEWSGSWAAGVAASLLFAFEPSRVADVAHLFIYDTTGLVLALLFASRLFRSGRTRDAIGLGIAGAVQVMTSFYPLLATAAIALPVAVWLGLRFGLRRALWSRLALSTAIVAAAAAFVYLPYLELGAAGTMPDRGRVVFATRPSVLPGGKYLPGVVAAALALSALPWRPRSISLLRSDPRPALLIGALLVCWLALGRTATSSLGLPHLYSLVAQWLPGLEQVRAPARVTVGLPVVTCALAGLGIGAVLRRLPDGAVRWASAGSLIAAIYVCGVHPGWVGLPSFEHRARELAPAAAELDFHQALAELSTGPLLELPFANRVPGTDPPKPRLHYMNEQTHQVFLNAYHGRRTSGCMSSYQPDRQRLYEIERQLDRSEVLDEFRSLGFTTIVVRNQPISREALAQLERASQEPDARVRKILEHEVATAYLFRDATDERAEQSGQGGSRDESRSLEPGLRDQDDRPG